MRGATYDNLLVRNTLEISIHAPLARCDHKTLLDIFLMSISIHAPLARCDKSIVKLLYFSREFQSTHLLRGATGNIHGYHDKPYNFNPRTSCEVRLNQLFSFLRSLTFQSTHLLRGATSGCASCLGASCDFNPRTSCEVRLKIHNHRQRAL